MKIKLRFSIYFIAGLIICCLSMGLTAMAAIEWLLPMIGVTEDKKYYDLYVLIVFSVHIIGCSLFFSWYFVQPLYFIMKWISNLSQGIYEPPYLKNKVYTKKERLRKPYQLYREVIANIHMLSNSLRQAEQDRTKLEEAKRDWIAGISHDIKTPLTYVMGYSALLLNEEYVWSNEEQRNFLNEIHAKSQSIEALIQDINLSFKMEDTQAPLIIQQVPVNIVKFMQGLILDVANDPRASTYVLSFYSEETDIIVSIDQKLMYRVLQNLLVNGIEHNPLGTSIQVTVSRENNEYIRIEVSDNGCGIQEEMLNNLFNKYYRGENANRLFGHGLGLAIVKSIIDAHGGQLTVQSELSKGTTFHIVLPQT